MLSNGENLLSVLIKNNLYICSNQNQDKMAKVNTSSVGKRITSKVSRPGVHAKTKTSKSKGSKNYKKAYKGQGK